MQAVKPQGLFYFMAYSEKLKDPRWQKMRLSVLNKAKFKCKWCGDEKEILHVHHIDYLPGRQPWEYEISNFLCLCSTCHKFAELQKTTPSDSVNEKNILRWYVDKYLCEIFLHSVQKKLCRILE